MKKTLTKIIVMTFRGLMYGIVLQVFFLSLLLANGSKAQIIESVKDVTISVNLQNASLRECFQEIEDQTSYRFSYDHYLIDKNVKINIKSRKKAVSDVLLEISKKADLKFMQINNNINVQKLDNVNPEGQLEIIIQGTTINGRVISSEDNEGLPGVNVIVKGTSQGTVTDVAGNYSLEVPGEESILVFSSVGFTKEEVVVGNQSTIDLTLTPDLTALDEIVVIGYGTARKSDLTGSVSSIKSEEILAVPTVRLDKALMGKVAGVQVTPTSSVPGAASSIRIRGTNSLTGNSSPLFVIDGLIGAGNSADINMMDIESVEVLKDASATALYGSRGSAGVILITTKRGKAGQGKVSYDGFYTFQSPTRFLPMLNAAEFGDWQNEVQGTTAYPDPPSLGEGTNWQEEVYQDNAMMMSHTLSASGGNEKSQYFVSGNFVDQDGIFRGGNLQRLQFRFNGDHKVNDWFKVGNSIALSRSKIIPRSSNIMNIAGYFPTLPVKDENGEYTIQTESSELSAENPVGSAAKNINLNTSSRILGTIFAEIEPLKDLKYKFNFGTDLNLSKRENYAPSTLFNQINDQGTASIFNNEYLSVLMEHTLTYGKQFGDHRIDGLLGYTRQTISESGSSVTTKDFTTDYFEYNNIDAGAVRSGATSYAQDFGLVSYLFRANYSYKGKYLVTFSARTDGSSNFASSQKYGTFPSAAFAWRVSDEAFMANAGVFDDLKFRVSYGILGNPAAGGSSLARLGSGFTYLFGPGQDVTNGIGLNRLGNENLKYETTNQLDVGIDAAFFNHRLQVTLDFYDKITNDLFANEEILWLAGVANSTIITNFGSMQNTGIEFSFNSVNIDRGDFKWETSFNITANKNKLLEIPDENGEREINRFGGVINAPSALLKEGEPVGVFYGLVRDGIWNTQDEIDAAGVTGQGVFPGGKKYADLSGPEDVPDGVIDLNDRTIIGNPNPDLFGGMGNTLTYKGFEFGIYLSFVQGNDIFNETDSRINTAFDNNVAKKFNNRWTTTNTDSNVPSVRGVFRSEIISESGVIEDGSFLRVRDLSLGYNFNFERASWIQEAKLYFTGTNLFLLDNYSGYDPEINRGDSNTRRGYDQAQDPALKSWTVGLRVNF